MEKILDYNFESFFNYSENEISIIHENAKYKNMFYALHGLNIYAFNLGNIEIDEKEYPKLKEKKIDVKNIIHVILKSYLERFKESLYPTIFHEFNILVDNNLVLGGLDEFIENITNDYDWVEYFFDKYPVALEFFENTVKYCISFIKEFLNRLDNDMFEIEDRFGLKISDLDSIETFTGDNHNNHQSVLKLSFDGKILFYKPRSLDNEIKINDLFQYLQREGLRKSILIPKVISKKDYGWMEGMHFKELNKKDEAHTFYFNQGINLAIFYIFNVTDLIGENLIALGKIPCYFDLECVFQPDLNEIPNFKIYEKQSEAARFIASSVLRTNLLPQFSFVSNDFQGFSNSGLSIVDTEMPTMVTKMIDGKFIRSYETINFKHSNTNIPSYDNKKIHAIDYLGDIIDGFKEGYDFVESIKQDILKYITKGFDDLKIRVLYRPTYVYSKLLDESYLPEYLNEFQKREELFKELEVIEFESIGNKKLITSEIQQLKNSDVPIFYSTSTGKDIISNNGSIIKREFFCTSGLDQVIRKLNLLNQDDKKRQVELIELSFCIHEGYRIKQKAYVCGDINFSQFDTKNIVINHNLIKKEVFYNYNKIKDSGFHSDGLYSNYGLIQTPSYTWGIAAQSWGLFDGLDGLSLFYLNLYKVYNNFSALEIGKNYIENGISQFIDKTDYYSKITGFNKISLFNYPISTFYIAEFYIQNDIEIKAMTQVSYSKILDWIEKYYKDDIDYDLLSGGAGTIIYLLKLYDRVKDDKILAICAKIANYLINSAVEIEKNKLCWVSKFGKALTGLSHGSSGIAFSLFKLESYINSPKIKAAAIKALNYERGLFDNEKKYWNYFTSFETNAIITAENHFWAYGSGGILQSRILISDYYTDEYIEQEIEIAVKNIVEKGWSGNFNYSSGVFGNIDVLNDFANNTNNIDLKSKLNGFLNFLIDEKRRSYDCWTCAPVGKKYNSNIEMIGFFTGISGISNTLLNMIDYEKTAKIFR